jgi:hypothetical protein
LGEIRQNQFPRNLGGQFNQRVVYEKYVGHRSRQSGQATNLIIVAGEKPQFVWQFGEAPKSIAEAGEFGDAPRQRREFGQHV